MRTERQSWGHADGALKAHPTAGYFRQYSPNAPASAGSLLSRPTILYVDRCGRPTNLTDPLTPDTVYRPCQLMSYCCCCSGSISRISDSAIKTSLPIVTTSRGLAIARISHQICWPNPSENCLLLSACQLGDRNGTRLPAKTFSGETARFVNSPRTCRCSGDCPAGWPAQLSRTYALPDSMQNSAWSGGATCPPGLRPIKATCAPFRTSQGLDKNRQPRLLPDSRYA